MIMTINNIVIIYCLENTGGTLKHLSSVVIHNVFYITNKILYVCHMSICLFEINSTGSPDEKTLSNNPS